MTIKEIKEELIKRYRFIYKNAPFILAPFMYEETEEELKETNIRRKKMGLDEENKPLIYFKQPNKKTLVMLEELLLSTIPLEETEFYNLNDYRLDNPEYLKKYKYGLELLEKRNMNITLQQLQEKIDVWKLLSCVRTYILNQSGDLKNKDKKLNALDIYFNIARYKNDGKVWESGYNLNGKDLGTNIYHYSAVLLKQPPEVKQTRKKEDIGVKNNEFINSLSNNKVKLTENEKQNIYLEFHDELPWDLSIKCDIEEEYIPTMIETRLIRPENTEPCNKEFNIKETDIFIRPNDVLYKYYHLCPHCGFIVNIPKEILSDGIKKRIEKRCNKDENLFRKMYLYSELKKLDDLSHEGQKKLLKKNN